MALVRRATSHPLVHLIVELVGFVLLLLVLSPLFLLLPKTLTANVLSNGSLAVVAVGWFLLAGRVVERRTAAQIGLPRQDLARNLLLGVAVGGCLMASIIGVMALAGWYRITSVEFSAGPLLAVLAIFFAAAVTEEVVFRGMAFRLLERLLGSWVAVALSALFFGVSHLITPHATLVGAFAIAATGGVASAALFMLTRSLWTVFGLHWAWNFFEGPIFGTQVSGRDTPVLLHSVTSGPTVWTGGSFGPEAGLVTVLIGGSVAVLLLVAAARRGCALGPTRSHRALAAPL